MSSEKPFWEGKTLMEIQNLDKRVKVTMENGDVFIGKLVRRSRDTDGICSLSMQLDAHRTYLHVFSAESSDTQPVIPSYVDTVELLDDPEYERIDSIEDVRVGDIFVAMNGNKFSVVAVDFDDDKTNRTLAVMVQVDDLDSHVWMFNSNFAYALRPTPKLPDHDGLWLDKNGKTRRWALSIETESFDLTFGSIHYAGTRLTIPIDDDEYMVYRVEIANHRRGSSSLVTFHLDRDDSRPEHKTVGQSASAYLSVDEAKQIMQALQQAIKEADDE